MLARKRRKAAKKDQHGAGLPSARPTTRATNTPDPRACNTDNPPPPQPYTTRSGRASITISLPDLPDRKKRTKNRTAKIGSDSDDETYVAPIFMPELIDRKSPHFLPRTTRQGNQTLNYSLMRVYHQYGVM